MAKLLETPLRPGVSFLLELRGDKGRVFTFNCTVEEYEGGLWTAACRELDLVTETEEGCGFADAVVLLVDAIVGIINVCLEDGVAVKSAKRLPDSSGPEPSLPHGRVDGWEYSFVTDSGRKLV